MTYELNSIERALVELRDDLYSGSWDKMLDELRDRVRNSRPYIAKMVKRLKEDIEIAETLKAYELKTKTNLADLLKE